MNLCDMVKEEENLMVASQQEAAKLNVENAKAEADAKGKYIVPKINGATARSFLRKHRMLSYRMISTSSSNRATPGNCVLLY